MTTPKKLFWVGTSLKDIRDMPLEVRAEFGHALREVQIGLFPNNAKPLKGLRGVFEIVCDFNRNTYRAVYVTKVKDEIYVLHVFQKKSTIGIKTPKHEIDLIKQRLKLLGL